MNPLAESPNYSRRRFIRVGGMTTVAAPFIVRAAGSPNNTVRLGVIGCGSRAQGLIGQFAKLKDVAVVALSDADSARLDSTASNLVKKGADAARLVKFQDYRKLLERPDIDAVVVASPNHWHTLHAIDAMRAGKDVYVEKPVSHGLWEGRQLVAAQHKYGRMLAAGFQSRSDPGPRDGFQFVREGGLGRIQCVHICCIKERESIGKRGAPLTPPATVDYNLWLGPSADQPLFREQFHYDWHWSWNTGNGEIGNQAPHEIDMANWLLDARQLPAAVHGCGGRFGWDDAGETPNMQLVWYELAGVPVVIEVDDLKVSPQRKVRPVRDGIRVGLVVRCEGGQLRGGLGGTYAVDPAGKTLRKFPGNGGATHQENFIAAVRSRRSADIASPVAQAERAAAIAHLANLSFRAGAPADAAALAQAAGENETAGRVLADHTKQLADWGLAKPPYTLGRKLELDPATGTLRTTGIDPALIRPAARAEFAIPELA